DGLAGDDFRRGRENRPNMRTLLWHGRGLRVDSRTNPPGGMRVANRGEAAAEGGRPRSAAGATCRTLLIEKTAADWTRISGIFSRFFSAALERGRGAGRPRPRKGQKEAAGGRLTRPPAASAARGIMARAAYARRA